MSDVLDVNAASVAAVAPAPTAAPAAAAPRAKAGEDCPSCHRSWGDGRSCQFCHQVEGLPVGVQLSSPIKRFAAYLVDSILVGVTLGIGYLVWSLIVFGRGQTPGKQLLGMRCVNLDTGTRTGWGRTFVREWIAKAIIGVLGILTLGIIYFWLIWDRDNQELWDKVVGTIVVDDPNGQVK